jgi:5-formyltetrahydrofolate cyclo-ligase
VTAPPPRSVAAGPRERVLAQRKALAPARITELSAAIAARFLAASGLERRCAGRAIALYRAMGSELSLAPLELALRRSGARLHYPRLRGSSDAPLEIVEAPGDAGWERGAFGFAQPAGHLPAADPGALELILVPGVAFGPSGERVGRGQGHYDRFLPRAPRALRVALAFDFQLLDELPQREWDQPVHWILTERREVLTPAARDWLQREGASE